VRWQKSRDFTPPRTYLLLRIEIHEVSWLADVGMGGISPTSALRLSLDETQETPHDPRKIVYEDGCSSLQVQIASEWQDACEFTLKEMRLLIES
jgi:N-hydroxyarylamine O-acetyltransferase